MRVLVCGGRDYGDREALTELATGSVRSAASRWCPCSVYRNLMA